jgi:hypothetical protein
MNSLLNFENIWDKINQLRQDIVINWLLNM